MGFRIDREESEELKGIEKSEMELAKEKVENMIAPRLAECESIISNY